MTSRAPFPPHPASRTATVEVLFFASLAERAGARSIRVSLRPDDRVCDLWERLRRDHPGLASVRFRPLVACDRAWAGWEQTLEGVREVAFVPPVSGG